MNVCQTFDFSALTKQQCMWRGLVAWLSGNVLRPIMKLLYAGPG